jgi:hypothetical protein
MSNWVQTIANLTWWCSLILPLLYLIKFKGASPAYKYFTYYLMAIGVVQFGQVYWTKIFDTKSNLVLFEFYLVLEFLFLTMFLRSLIGRRWPIWISYSVMLILVLQIIFYPDGVQAYNGAGVAMTHLTLVIMCISYLYRCLTDPGDYIVLVAGLLLYLPISTIIFLAGNLIFDPEYAQSLSINLIIVNAVAYFALQLLFISLWFYWLRRKRSHSS